MMAFIEELRSVFGVGPICRVLGIAPSTCYGHKAVERDPDRAWARAKRISRRIPLVVLFKQSDSRIDLYVSGSDIKHHRVSELVSPTDTSSPLRTLRLNKVIFGKDISMISVQEI